MKEILLVAATFGETQLIRKELFGTESETPFLQKEENGQTFSLMHTGIGMVNTAFHLGSYLSHHEPELMINFGIAGSFEPHISLGEVVEIREDIFGEMGANSPRGYLDMEKLGFSIMEKNGQRYFNRLSNPFQWPHSLKSCKGITVNEVSGIASQIAFRQFKWEADVESMESAAFFQAALWFDIPFLAFRSISNYVEPRDKSKWKIGLAINNMEVWLLNQIRDRAFNSIGKFDEIS
ncbi:MAG: futalosine hydrolase [Bacteroidota bacterium]